MKRPECIDKLLSPQLGSFSFDVYEVAKYVEFLESKLRFASGALSGQKDFQDKHPEECFNWIMSSGETFEKAD